MASKIDEISDKYWDGDNDELTTSLEECGDAISEFIPLEDDKNITALIIYLGEYITKDQAKDLGKYFKNSAEDYPE